MKYLKAKDEFISAWGTLGSSWGINKTMAQIFALLLISPKRLSVEEIMEELQISRGNASMNLRSLIEWELVNKHNEKGERKEYFHTDRDVWALCRKVAQNRKDREVKPVLKALQKVSDIEVDNSEEQAEFIRVIKDLTDVVSQTNDALSYLIEKDRNWIANAVYKMLVK